jgi:hypothetical protein
MAAVKQVIDLPAADPMAPGIFRLATPGEFAGMLGKAGLTDITDQEFLGEWSYGSTEQYYTSLMEIAAPIQNLMATLSEAQRLEVKHRIIKAASQFQRGAHITFPIAVRMIAGRKPG